LISLLLLQADFLDFLDFLSLNANLYNCGDFLDDFNYDRLDFVRISWEAHPKNQLLKFRQLALYFLLCCRLASNYGLTKALLLVFLL